MNRKLAALAVATAGFASLAVAGPPAAADPVAASFQRLLDHTPVTTAPAVPPGTAADPLRQAISAVLWDKQPSSYHAALQAPASPKR